MKNFIESEDYKYRKAKNRAKQIRGFYFNLFSYCLVIPTIVVFNLVYMTEFHFFWFSMIGWGVGVILQGMWVFGYHPFMRKNWEENKLNELIEKDNMTTNTITKSFKTADSLGLEQQRFNRAKKRIKALAGFYKHLIAYILVNAFLIAMKYYQLQPGESFIELSTFSTAIFWGIGLGFHTLSVFGTTIFLGKNWEENKINEYMNNKQTSKWE